jgi:oxalate---CoA ligase
LSVQPEGPYFLGGYSFGGLVAFDMAQQLRRRGEKVALLALLEATTPGAGPRSAGKLPSKNGAAQGRLKRHLSSLRPLTAAQRFVYAAVTIKALAQRLTRFAKLKRAARRAVYRFCERRGRTLPSWVRTAYLLDIYTEAARRYQAEIYPGKVWFIKGAGNRHDHLAAWSRLVAGPMAVYMADGHHATLIEEPQLKSWAEQLNDRLNLAEFEAQFESD